MSATIFKKELLTHVNFEELFEFKYCGDWYFLIALARQCEIAYIAKAMNYFKYGTNNFKKGTKSALNYHKERSLVRYFFWANVRGVFDMTYSNNLVQQLNAETKIMVYETIKGRNSISSFISAILKMKKVNRQLAFMQIGAFLNFSLWKG